MKFEELVEAYEKALKAKKEYDFSKLLKIKYMPYSEKCALVKSIVDNTSYIEVNGKKIYKRNTSRMLFIFTMKLIDNYIDLEIPKDEVVFIYDSLMKSGLMNRLMNQIPEEEIKILRGMLDMQRDDEEANTRSLISFFETKTDAMHMLFDRLLALAENPEVQAKINKMISEK